MSSTAIFPITVEIDATTFDRIERLALSRSKSSKLMVAEAIREYLGREEKLDAFEQAAVEASEHYQKTGLHVTAEEADAWLAELEAGNDIDPPPCHV